MAQWLRKVFPHEDWLVILLGAMVLALCTLLVQPKPDPTPGPTPGGKPQVVNYAK
jgi:hypothetical protein